MAGVRDLRLSQRTDLDNKVEYTGARYWKRAGTSISSIDALMRLLPTCRAARAAHLLPATNLEDTSLAAW